MNQIKRQFNNPINKNNNNNNKKLKIDNELIISSKKTYLENLANETIYEIFEYLNIYHIYYSFFHLNTRFNHLILYSNSYLQIYIPTMNKINFELYLNDFIRPNRNRINKLYLSNPFTIDLIFSPPRSICQFNQLENIIFDHIDSRYLKNILQHLSTLKKLRSLKLSLIDKISNPNDLFISIFRLRHLKTCHLTYELKNPHQPIPIDITKHRKNSMENLTIKTSFPFHSLSDLFIWLPKLRYLSIDYLISSNLTYLDLSSIVLKDLKYVSFKIENIHINILEKLCHYYFHSIEKFSITIKSNSNDFNSNKWKQIIETSMPNLRIFDLYYIDSIQQNEERFHSNILPFNDSFWIQNKWYFTHQHDYRNNQNRAILYSTNPYRRKDFTFHLKPCKNSNFYSNKQVENFNSVEHLTIYGTKIRSYNKYFPNVIELTIGSYLQSSNQSIDLILDQILPLKQLKILSIQNYQFPFEDMLKILSSTIHLHTLKLYSLVIPHVNISLIELNNQIKSFHLYQLCPLNILKFILQLFPCIEYLEIGMMTNEIYEILRYLFPKTNKKIHQLKFLCFSQTPQRCLKEINFFIKLENLIQNYSIKLINRKLYLWW